MVSVNEKYLKISKQLIQDSKRWKRHYGLRSIGETEEGETVIYGLDVFKFVTSQGVDLTTVLDFLKSNNCVVDWLGFSKAAILEGWIIFNLLKRISHPIIDVYGERYWVEVRIRIGVWFIEYINTEN